MNVLNTSLRAILTIGFLAQTASGCAAILHPEAESLDKAIAKSDLAEIEHTCRASYSPPPPKDVQERACAYMDKRSSDKFATATCENFKHLYGGEALSTAQAADYEKLVLGCHDWSAVWETAPIAILKARRLELLKTPEGEASFRKFLTTATAEQLGKDTSMKGLDVFEDLKGDGSLKLHDEVATAIDKVSFPASRTYMFDYLVAGHHPKAVALATENLNDTRWRFRSNACWALGAMKVGSARSRMEELAKSDSYHEVNDTGGVTYPVRDACQSALSKLSK
jgi:hypothetical protein